MDRIVSVHDVQPRGDDPLMTHSFDVPNAFVGLTRLELVVDDFGDYLKCVHVCVRMCVCITVS